jgi:hypothetical protein
VSFAVFADGGTAHGGGAIVEWRAADALVLRAISGAGRNSALRAVPLWLRMVFMVPSEEAGPVRMRRRR